MAIRCRNPTALGAGAHHPFSNAEHSGLLRVFEYRYFIASYMALSKKSPKAPASAARHWLVKSEPAAYSWADLVRDGHTAWTGVRNFQARINLNAMRPGDQVLFYESMTTKAVVGLAAVTRAAFPDTTADEPGWVAIELKAAKTFSRPVTLAAIKSEPSLANLAFLRQSRLSVSPLSPQEYAILLKLGS